MFGTEESRRRRKSSKPSMTSGLWLAGKSESKKPVWLGDSVPASPFPSLFSKIGRPQGLEMPPMHPGVTASQGPQLVGPPWSAVPRVPWPAGVPRGRDGPRVPATVARCPGAYRLSKRLTQQALEAIGGLPRRGATVSPWEQATTTVCAAPGEEARPSGHAQGVAHLAETSGRHGDQRRWLWGAVTRGVTVFVGRLSRGGDGARARRGEPWAGLVGTDRSRASHG